MILAIDLGGTEVKIGLVDGEGRVRAKTAESVAFDGYRTPILDTTIRAAERFLAEQGCPVEGIAVSACGQIDPESGTVIGTNGKIPHYEGVSLKAELEKKFGKETWVLNDANAAALGEGFAGRARGLKDVILVTLGTGVGGGVITGGRLLGLVARCEKASGRTGLNGKVIFREAEAGDPVFRRELEGWISDIAAGLTGLIHIFNPEMVLIGGGVSAQEEMLIRPLREKVMAEAMPRFTEKLRIERAMLGNDAGMIGAAGFWLERQSKKRSERGQSLSPCANNETRAVRKPVRLLRLEAAERKENDY